MKPSKATWLFIGISAFGAVISALAYLLSPAAGLGCATLFLGAEIALVYWRLRTAIATQSKFARTITNSIDSLKVLTQTHQSGIASQLATQSASADRSITDFDETVLELTKQIAILENKVDTNRKYLNELIVEKDLGS